MTSLVQWKEMLLRDRVGIQNELDRVQGTIERLEETLVALKAQLNATNGALNVVEKQIAELPKPQVVPKAEGENNSAREDKRK